MTKKKNKNLMIFMVVALLVVGMVVYSQRNSQADSFLSVNFYDKSGRLIKAGASSVVGGLEGVRFINFDITVTNLDSVPLIFQVTQMTPSGVNYASPTQNISIQPGESQSTPTELIDILTFEGGVQEFCVTVKSFGGDVRDDITKSACVSLDIQPNPLGQFDVGIDPSVEGSDVNPGCTENWQCSAWGTCAGGIQTRVCTDLNTCGTTNNKPAEQQFCSTTPAFTTNAVGGNYGASGVYITLSGLRYDR